MSLAGSLINFVMGKEGSRWFDVIPGDVYIAASYGKTPFCAQNQKLHKEKINFLCSVSFSCFSAAPSVFPASRHRLLPVLSNLQERMLTSGFLQAMLPCFILSMRVSQKTRGFYWISYMRAQIPLSFSRCVSQTMAIFIGFRNSRHTPLSPSQNVNCRPKWMLLDLKQAL